MTEHDEDAVVERCARQSGSADILRRDFVTLVLETLKPGDRLPGGLRVVPEEPSETMTHAEGETWDVDYELWADACARVYRAMLAASTD